MTKVDMISMPNRIRNVSLTMIALVLMAVPVFTQPQALGDFDNHTDVGQVKKPGAASYDAEEQAYTVSGAGTNMWADRDEFHFVWKRMKGNFILQTRAAFAGQGVDAHRKLGWIVRQSLDSDSPHVNATVHGDGLTSLQFRRQKQGQTEELKSPVKAADVIQLERKGDAYIMSVARFGDPFTAERTVNLPLGEEVYVGLYVCSHNPEVVERAVFSDVRVIVPARENFVAYKEYIGSDLEILDVASGRRKIVYHAPDSIQAPNWTVDNQALIYNSNGRLYRFDLANRTPAVIDTDFAVRNNNDHVLSFDGKMLGISHHSQEDRKSIVYTVPVGGGKPVRVTAEGPSYLHGWSPDGKFLTYTGQRNGEFDIYKIPAQGGAEIRLTTAQGLDDGSEFSPDGRYIYFNSARTGTMQIWRMKPDGGAQEQVTFDEFNNWFPHVSPDNKWIVFLSFSKDVPAQEHPFYKQVYLRLMPVAGGTPKVVAYVYGGQGTINTPSWSPDSKKVAFVSNTDLK